MKSFSGAMRSLAAADRRREREARRRQRELERQQKEIARMEELVRAKYEVDVFENRLDVLISIHKECGPEWDWSEIAESSPPPKPERKDTFELEARNAWEKFKPGFSDKLLRRTETKLEALKAEVDLAIEKDNKYYQGELQQHESDLAEWSEFRELAHGIIVGDVGSFVKAVKLIDPFSELIDLGSSVEFSCDDASLIEVTIFPHGEDVIPKESKSLLKSGKVSVKNMPKERFYELYQDYVCGCVLRVARELFAILPSDMSIIAAMTPLLNTTTGHMEDQPIVSAAISRSTVETLNFDYLDPSDSLANFVHNMNFRKTKGFAAVERVSPSSFQ